MQQITAWSQRWGLPSACLQELMAIMGVAAGAPPPPATGQPGSEAGIQAAVRLAAARQGILLWRNNVGVAMGENGVPIRFGLCNDSKQLNAICKSSDLIGIGPDGRFHAYECKKNDWKYRDSDQRAKSQLAFIKLVLSRGGVAKFIQQVEDL